MKLASSLNDLWASIVLWFRIHPRKRIIAVAGIVLTLCLITGVLVWSLTPAPKASAPVAKTAAPKPSKPTPKYYSPLTGELVDSQAAAKQAVTAIMIENSPDARPQSGIKSAGVVYEAIAEGGITRFLALYQQEKPQLVGPVRSVRMYYVDWLAPYQASIAHVGGSAAALAEVRNGSYRDIDQFFNGATYWRASDRAAPHNVYTSFAKLDALNQAKGYTSSDFKSFSRTDKPVDTKVPASSVAIKFSGPLYNTSYSYDATTKTYLRSVGGEPHMDRENGQISPSVVVAMHVDMTTVLEDGYRGEITTTGAGKAEVFQNGMVTECTWRKNSRSEPLELIDANGQPVELARGQTWIAAVPNNGGGVSWQ